MKLTLGQKLFCYTGSLLVLLLLATFLILEQSQSRQWESYLRMQSLSFARLATPELLKRFRGDFSGMRPGSASEHLDFLAVNRDLVAFSLSSFGGKLLYRSELFPGFSKVQLPGDDLFADPEGIESTVGARFVTRQLSPGGRILCVEVPASGPTGETVLTARYIFSYNSVDQRIAEVRTHFLRLLLISIVVSFLLVAVVARRVVGPIRELNRGVVAVSRGDLQTRMQVAGGDEISTLARAFNAMAESLATSRTELTNKNLALEHANIELRKMHEGLVRAERLAATGQLAAGVSHEIDNPVGIILGLAELMLEDTPVTDPRHDDLLTIIEECKRCRRITGGLLGFARSSAGEFGKVDLVSLIADLLDSIQPQKLFKNLDIAYRSDPIPLVCVDEDQIRQVLINLCINAAQAMAGIGRLELRVFREEIMAVVEVRDNGPGIPVALKEKVFEPFFSTKGRGEGTGLGLSICRKLIEDHGGRLTVEDSAGQGACFRISLPLAGEEKNFDKGSGHSIG